MWDLDSKRVLVLNRQWLAIHVCSLRRALSLLYQDSARVVDQDYQTFDFESWCVLSGIESSSQDVIRTPSYEILVPSVVVLLDYQRCPPRSLRFNRQSVFERDAYSCQYCGTEPGRGNLTLDHVVPRSRGGKSNWHNVVVACMKCNTKKGSRLPAECGMHPKVPPKRPSWVNSLRLNGGKHETSLWKQFVNAPTFEPSMAE